MFPLGKRCGIDGPVSRSVKRRSSILLSFSLFSVCSVYIIFWWGKIRFQFSKALWEFQYRYGGLPRQIDDAKALQAIADSIVSAAGVHKDVITAVPGGLIA